MNFLIVTENRIEYDDFKLVCEPKPNGDYTYDLIEIVHHCMDIKIVVTDNMTHSSEHYTHLGLWNIFAANATTCVWSSDIKLEFWVVNLSYSNKEIFDVISDCDFREFIKMIKVTIGREETINKLL